MATVMVALHGVEFAWPQSQAHWGPITHTWSPGLGVIVGEDGAGKSTWLRVLSGDLTPLRGHVERPHSVFWCDPAKDDGTSTELADLYLARQQATHAATWQPQELARWVEAFELQPHLSKPWWGLSMGMRRLVRLCAAAASGAALTLVDDPWAALDAKAKQRVKALLNHWAVQNQRLFVTTDYQVPDWGVAVQVLALPSN